MTLSTHVLDVEAGRPVGGCPILVERLVDATWRTVRTAVTDADGRVGALVDEATWRPGRWRLTFDTGAVQGAGAFYPQVCIHFDAATADHHHIPLLLARHGYSTYRGS